MNLLTLEPASRAQGSMRLPGSKSLSIRALLLASLASGQTVLTNVLDSDDTQVMRAALQALGVSLRPAGEHALSITGGTPYPAREADIFVRNSGLSIRTLCAVLARMPGRFRLHGVPRMHERPIGDLVQSLAAFGAQIVYEQQAGYPPLVITGNSDLPVEIIRVKGNASSQYLTGLLQVAPIATAHNDVVIQVEGELISKPYVDMTVALMQRFGVIVQRQGYESFCVPRGSAYRSVGTYAVEGDASSASYFLAAGVLGRGPLRVQGVGRSSLQGDVRFADFLETVGAQITWGNDWIEASGTGTIKAFDQDFNHIPDAAMTAAVMALFAAGPCTLRNIGSWRLKETDRLSAMACELRKCGAQVVQAEDWLRVVPPERVLPATIATYDDHRMAMSFSLARFGGSSITIEEPECTAKTFPRFFDTMKALVS